jgi:hypothetical protein
MRSRVKIYKDLLVITDQLYDRFHVVLKDLYLKHVALIPFLCVRTLSQQFYEILILQMNK